MKLFSELASPFGVLSNRVAMAPMTRAFCDSANCPSRQAEQYYSSRALAGASLIITEGIIVDASGDGYANVPHLSTFQQRDCWAAIVSSVQRSGGRIIAQLWHCGRLSHESFTGGIQPISSSPVRADGINRQNGLPYGMPREMNVGEGPIIVGHFVRAAKLAKEAGFDGVEIHGGHGYLLEQFMDSNINVRKDKYGGSIENRCRLLFEIVASVGEVFGPNRIAIRLSPRRQIGSVTYEIPEIHELLAHLAARSSELGVGALDVSCAHAPYESHAAVAARILRRQWKSMIIGGASLDVDAANSEIEAGVLDIVTWGRAFIGNPELPRLLRDRRPITPFDRAMLANL